MLTINTTYLKTGNRQLAWLTPSRFLNFVVKTKIISQIYNRSIA